MRTWQIMTIAWALTAPAALAADEQARDGAPDHARQQTQALHQEVRDHLAKAQAELRQAMEEAQQSMAEARRLAEQLGADKQLRHLDDALARMREVRTEKGAWLGVGVNKPSETLVAQAQLPRGVGLVVNQVMPSSPAAEAGLKEHDVLHKLNDQILVNPEQLSVLVRTHKPGDSIQLTVIRGGEQTRLTAKLVEKDLPPLAAGWPDLQPRLLLDPDAFPRDAMVFPGGIWDPKNRIIRLNPHGDAMTLQKHATALGLKDAEHELMLTFTDGESRLVAKDSKGNVIFDGPVDTIEQRQAVPEEIKEKLMSMLLTRPAAPQPARKPSSF